MLGDHVQGGAGFNARSVGTLAIDAGARPAPFFALFPNEFGQGAFFPSLTALFTFGLFDRLVRLHTKGEDHKLKIPFFSRSNLHHDSMIGLETSRR